MSTITRHYLLSPAVSSVKPMLQVETEVVIILDCSEHQFNFRENLRAEKEGILERGGEGKGEEGGMRETSVHNFLCFEMASKSPQRPRDSL